MELKDLVGEHELSGVDSTTEENKRFEFSEYREVQVIRFVLDGNTYKATEDPDDGYRSYLSEIEVTNENVTNNFPPQKVIGKMKADAEYEKNDVMQFIDVVTGGIVLEVGTDYYDDYYPICIMFWNPENLAINNRRSEVKYYQPLEYKMNKYNLDKLVKVECNGFSITEWYEYRKKKTILGLVIQEEGIYDFILGDYLGIVAPEHHILNNEIIYEKPNVTLHYQGGHKKTYYFESLEEAKKFADEFTKYGKWEH